MGGAAGATGREANRGRSYFATAASTASFSSSTLKAPSMRAATLPWRSIAKSQGSVVTRQAANWGRKPLDTSLSRKIS